MSTVAHTFDASRQEPASRYTLPPRVASAMTFWFPLLTVSVAAYLVQHNWEYSSPSYIEGLKFVDAVDEVGRSNLGRQLGVLSVGAVGVALIAMRSRIATVVDFPLAMLIVFLMTWTIFSSTWSDDSHLTMKRSFQPILLLVGAVGIAKHLPPSRLCRFIAIVAGSLLAVGIVAALAQHTLSLSNDYRFTGTTHSNFQATVCAALCLASLSLYLNAWRDHLSHWAWLWLIPFFVGFGFLLLARSRTTTLALMFAFLVFYITGALPRRRLIMGFALMLIACVAAVVLLGDSRNSGELVVEAVSMGREDDINDATSLTGRLPVWNLAAHHISQQPILGYGYGAYWSPQRVLDYSDNFGWEPTHAHSAYLESLINVGAVGLLIGLGILGRSLLSAIASYRQTEDIGFRFITAVLAMALIHGLLDSNYVLVGFDLMLIMMCIATVMLHYPQSNSLGAEAHIDRRRTKQ